MAIFSGIRQLACHMNGRQKARRVSLPAAGDVKSRAVVRAGAHQRQAQRDIDALLHPQVFHGNQPLVVVHRHHHIK